MQCNFTISSVDPGKCTYHPHNCCQQPHHCHFRCACRWLAMNVTQVPSTSSMRPCLSSLRKLSLAMRPTSLRSSSAVASQAPMSAQLCRASSTHRQLSARVLSPAAQHALQQQRPAVSRSLVTTSAAAPAVAEQPTSAPTSQQQSGHSNGAGSKDTASTAPTFQEAVKRLQDYWSAQGCIVWLPHNTEVGAGTMNPATFLR